MTDKDTLRRIARAARLEAPASDRKKAALKLAENFLNNIQLPQDAIVAGYYPVRAEMDVLPVLEGLSTRGYSCALPVIETRNTPLKFRRWDATVPLKEGPFSIPEPDADFTEAVTPQVLLVPMLGFDANGNRLGYGAGHYDRTLEIANPKPLLIGVAYAFQQFEAVPSEAHDYKMDIIVTDNGIYRFGKERPEYQ